MHGFYANVYGVCADFTQILQASLKFRLFKTDMKIETTLLYTAGCFGPLSCSATTLPKAVTKKEP